MHKSVAKVIVLVLLPLFFLQISCKKKEDPQQPDNATIQLVSVKVGPVELSFTEDNTNLPIIHPIVIRFSVEIDTSTVEESIMLMGLNSQEVTTDIAYLDNNKTVSLKPVEYLDENQLYTVIINDKLKGTDNQSFKGIEVSFQTAFLLLELNSLFVDSMEYDENIRLTNADLKPEIDLTFSHSIDLTVASDNIKLYLGSMEIQSNLSAIGGNKFRLVPQTNLQGLMKYKVVVSSNLVSEQGNEFAGSQAYFYTMPDSTPKFPNIPDNDLLTLVQEQTFKYFWDFAHPVSGLARERNTSDETVTSGGSGFGLMAIIVGIERGFVTRAEGVDRLSKIVDFLGNNADRFHGAWSHWLNGTTGEARPFSSNDDGGDLVETSFMAMGLLTVRQYLDSTNTAEKALIDNITLLWESIEWDWYRQNDQNVLYWHWSPYFLWEKNMKIAGYNEALITYVLGASSPTFGIDANVYHEGWAKNGNIINGNDYYGINLPLGQSYGGPLFFTHYSFLGLNPNGLSDNYANYLEQNVNHTQINRAYCIENPQNYVGYSEKCWGLTASDGYTGYSAHSPTNDRGVITPTAALSSFPYTPEESMEALKFFYYIIGDRLWGEYGFYDAFNITENWTAGSTLAIDQGPIIIMIENYRTSLLWDLFMSDPDVQNGLDLLGFTY